MLAKLHAAEDADSVKWKTAVGQVRGLAASCAEMSAHGSTPWLPRVQELWAVGDLLESPRDLDWITCVPRIDAPVESVPWWCLPQGASTWADVTRASKNPVLLWWRSLDAPVWNHRIVGPVLVWDSASGVREDALSALLDGRASGFRLAQPGPEAYAARLADEAAISLEHLRRQTGRYDAQRYSRQGARGDDLFDAAQGYLDVVAAIPLDNERPAIT